MESIAFQVEDVVEAMDVAAGRIGTLLADGGASRNPTLMQIQADISGRDVYRAADADLSALGAAHLAGRTAGVWTQQDLENLPRPRDHFEPAESAQQRTRRRSGWQAAVRRARRQADKVDGPF
jgi:glycerol kinase